MSQTEADFTTKIEALAAHPHPFSHALELVFSLEESTNTTNIEKSVHKLAADLQTRKEFVLLPIEDNTIQIERVCQKSLKIALDFLFTMGGTALITSFFMTHEFTPEVAKQFILELAALPPSYLGTEFHVPRVLDTLDPQVSVNYVVVATLAWRCFVLNWWDDCLSNELPDLPGVVYAGSMDLSSKCEDDGVRSDCLAKLAEIVIANFSELNLKVFEVISTSSWGAVSLLNSCELGGGLDKDLAVFMTNAPDAAVSLLSLWFGMQRYEYAIRMLLLADSIMSCQQWLDAVNGSIAPNPAAFGAFVDLLLSEELEVQPSLRLAAAIAMLTQTAELPSDFPGSGEKLQSLQLQLMQNNPRLINFGHGHDEAILANQNLPTFPPAIEEEMRTCFQRMYEQQYDITDVVTLLGRLKSSDIPEDQDLFACIVHSLFDEYHFFFQYPVKALATTAVLFGSLVHFRLIEGTPLAVAFKFILDALRHPTDSNMFRFGLQALVEMCPRLPEFPKYCNALMQVPGLQSDPLFLADLKGYIDPKSETLVFKSVNPVSEDGESESSPKLDFAVNNLSAKTLVVRSTEITKEIASLGSLRFVRLLVKRAMSEPNYHALYASLLDLLPAEVLETCTNAIIARVATLLSSPKLMESTERQNLQNLGQFLGMLTLARNRPLWFHHVNLRLLIAEAASFEKLPAVLPFVTKLLTQSSSSKVFKPSSPWVSQILSVLSELYTFGGLTLNMKFAIEVLGQNLKVDIPNLEPDMYIRDEQRQSEDIISITTSITGQPPGGHPPVQVPVAPMPVPPPPNAAAAVAAANANVANVSNVANIPNVPNVNVNAAAVAANAAPMTPVGTVPMMNNLVGTTEFITHPILRQILEIARNKTLQSVLLPVVERSVSIASFTAKELVAKDYAFETDMSKKQAAAHALVLSLAPSMSFVTAKEPFIEALTHNIRTLLVTHNLLDAPGILDQSMIAARETFDTMLPVIESIARERAMFEVDEALAQPQLPVVPMQMPGLLGHYQETLPEQHAVYLSFANGAASDGDIIARITDLLLKLETLTRKQTKLVDLKTDDEVLDVLTQFVTTVQIGARKSEETPLHASIIIIQLLFRSTFRLYREALCLCLGELCKVSSITAKEIVMWLLYADDTKKYNAEVISTLLRSRLVTPAEIDASLTKDLTEPEVRTQVVDYAVRLLLDALLGPEPYCLRSDFAGTITVLTQLSEHNAFLSAKVLIDALEETKGDGIGNEAHVFAEWTRLMQHHTSANSPVLLHKFVSDLRDAKWLEGNQLVNFITTAVEVSVRSYLQSHSFVGVDAVATLITTILETTGHPPQVAKALLSVIVFSLAKDHDNENFDSLPYYRLLSTIACSINFNLIDVFCEIVLALQPTAFPGFTASWISLMSHRHVMGKLLDSRYLWPILRQLFVALFQSLREIWLAEGSNVTERGFTYRAVERICLVVLHDEPEFFLRYGQELSTLLVFEFIQLKNMLQSGFPKSIQLPDPSELKGVEYHACDQSTLGMIVDSQKILNKVGVLKLVESTCQSRNATTMPPATIASIATCLRYTIPLPDRGIDFDSIPISMPVANALISVISSMMNNANFEEYGGTAILTKLLVHVQKDARYFIISAIVNFLKYPDVQTEFCVQFVLSIFLPFGEKALGTLCNEIRHIVTRVLLERLVSYRPHPWGVMAVFMALLRNPEYKFWEMPFVKTSPEVANLFSTLAPNAEGSINGSDTSSGPPGIAS